MTPLRRFKSFAPGYFETMGNRLVAGRTVTWSEIHERRPVIVISEPLAREYWKEPSRAIGRRVRALQRGAPWREIVGVVGGERDDGLNQPATAIVYWPMLNENYRWRTMAYAVRSNRVGRPGFLRELEQAVWSVNPNLPLAAARTLENIRANSMAQTSFALVMLGIAASVALLIGVVGIYGVIAYAATQRTREIGVRMALGAQVGDVRKMFLRQGLSLTATGIVLGIGVAVVITRVMSAFLFGVGPMDPTTYAVVSGALAAVALLATYLPARRASRVDPMIALRTDV
jgi:predicted permease